MENRINNNDDAGNEKEINLKKEINEESLSVVFRLYDKTFKELVER